MDLKSNNNSSNNNNRIKDNKEIRKKLVRERLELILVAILIYLINLKANVLNVILLLEKH